MLKLVSFLFVIAFVYADEQKHWALIVAGSEGWDNYRHQADACHAYQIMKKHGIPDERIIVMMYDDIAHNIENPTPGIVINRPNGPDVYHGVPKDYTHSEVTPKNFLAALTGDEEGLASRGLFGKKVIKSGPNDHIFVNFADHGAPGILAFYNKFLHARDLMSAINKMHSEQKYAKMVFYIEACESGSMFQDLLPKDINVFATTAANAHESSYACYFDKKRRTYLGDVYSVMWMEDSDKEDLQTETLQKQFLIVKEETNTSHCQEYGDMSISNLDVAEFQGKMKSRTTSKYDRIRIPNPNFGAVKSEDVPLAIQYQSVKVAETEEEKDKYLTKIAALEQKRTQTIETFRRIISVSLNHDSWKVSEVMSSRMTLRNFDCYEPIVEALRQECPGLNIPQNDYALRHLYTFVNLCEIHPRLDNDEILDAISKVAEVPDSGC
ncbi:legumain-like isoform X1 [Gigantopelta aegis]|uniref:legumain-like isoform X1 n=1 Tax=Gigantopelta aegis TaxID=1735272 RepID=UPI001B888474|nr:legumain-like isoform X1 [Gigantopelta aegis]